MATAVDACDRILAAARGAATVFMLAENSQYWPEVMLAGEQIAAGAIGEIVTAQVHLFFPPLEAFYGGERAWRMNRQQTGGGICIDTGSHYIRPLRLWLGEIDEVVAAMEKPHEAMEGESLARALFRFRSGRVASFDLMITEAPTARRTSSASVVPRARSLSVWSTSRCTTPSTFKACGWGGRTAGVLPVVRGTVSRFRLRRAARHPACGAGGVCGGGVAHRAGDGALGADEALGKGVGMSGPRVTFDFAGCRVLVTGGSNGIGAGIARAFAGAGARVTITGTRASAADYDSDLSAYDYHQLSLTDRGWHRAGRRLSDVARRAGQQRRLHAPRWAERVHSGRLRGGRGHQSVRRVPHGAGVLRQAAGECSRGRASVINLASMSSFFAVPMVPGYGAAKAAVVQMTKNLAVVWAGDGIRVNAVAPGSSTPT